MNSKFQKIMVAIIAILVFVVTFFGSSREQVIVETKKIVSDSNNINNKYLVGVEWLNENIHNANLVILDIRSKKQYDEGHIPGAINVSWNQFISDSSNDNGNENNTNNENSNNQNSDNETSNSQNVNTQSNSDNQNNTNSNSSDNSTTENNENSNGESTNNSTSINNEENSTKNWTASLSKKKLSKELQNLGITQKSIVVIYGDSNSQNLDDLGKFSWMFRMVGIDSKMLNGGYDNWKAEGFESIKGVPLPKKSNIEIENFVTSKAITLDDIKKNISKLKIVQLVNDIKPKNINTNDSQTNGANNQNANSNSSNMNGQNQVNNSGLNNQEVNLNASNSSNSGNNSNSSTNTSNGTNQAYITESNLPPAGVTQIKLSELLNPNGTIKSVNRLDNLFNNKGINQNDIILFYNSDKGNIAFISLILNMAGFNNIKYYNANLTQVAAIRNAIINQQNNPNSNSGSNSNSGNSANTNNNSGNSNNSNNSTATSDSTNSSTNNNSENSSNNNSSNN